jgi:phenylacetate-CoA ligase
MYLFGKEQQIHSLDDLQQLMVIANHKSHLLVETPLGTIIDLLHQVGQQWLPGGKWYLRALKELTVELPFSESMIKATLDIVPGLLDRDELQQRIRAEFINESFLDTFHSRHDFKGKVRAFPLGTLLHVSAGNVFLGCIDSLLMGFLTKNINILKLSSRNQTFPRMFAQSLLEVDVDNILADKFAILYWKGGSKEYEALVKKECRAIIAWGGETMLQSYQQDLPMDTKILDYGPKLSIQVLSKAFVANNSFKDIARKIVQDVALWDQAACAASQNLYVEEGVDITRLMQDISQSFESFEHPRGEFEGDEYVDILKEKYRAEYDLVETGIDYIEGENYLIHFDPDDVLRPSPLNRTLIIKPYKNIERLAQVLDQFRFYLQSCGLGVTVAERNKYLSKLGAGGIKRFTDLGKMLSGMTGAPHDGRYGLTELVNIVALEHDTDLQDFLNDITHNVPFYEQYQNKKLEDFPLVDGKDLARYGMGSDNQQMIYPGMQGFVFASGGTSGSPKYSLYTAKEFDVTCELLADSYMHTGLKSGDVVANMFVSGNMWSSFSAVQLALQKCPVMQLPIGGQVSTEDFQSYCERFRPNVIFGLPGLLADLATKTQSLQFETVFYAGEMLKDSTAKLLKEIWGVKNIYSAGYASVDVGPIGYQVPSGKTGEHYLFPQIHMEIIEDELVVTSLVRKSMPIVRYRTGDKVKLLQRDEIGIKFQLLGRADELIQLWGARFYLHEIEKALTQNKQLPDYQVHLVHDDKVGDMLEIYVDAPLMTIDQKHFCENFYEHCRDLQQTIELSFLINHVRLKFHTLTKNARTGKVSKLLDLR